MKQLTLNDKKMKTVKTKELVEKMFFSYFNPDNGVKFVHIKEDDTLYVTEDGTPETCHLSISNDAKGMHIMLHHGSWNREEWEVYLIHKNKILKDLNQETAGQLFNMIYK